MQSNDIAIQVTDLGKCYKIYDTPFDRLKQTVIRSKKFYNEFWALQNINFQIKKGDAFGIIGRNGSGKSTLLQLLCKTLTPTTGRIEISGRVTALLELGAGFNPEFTGRENVYLNGAILGLTQQDVDAKFDEIAAFADINKFMDQPVKTYSSGMFVRLAFAVQASVEPDILIIDEALSVGDIFFQQKCHVRMRQLREQGTTLIFVSHDMATVRDLCKDAIYLKSGRLILAGPSTQAISKYFAETNSEPCNVTTELPTVKLVKPHSQSQDVFIQQFKELSCWQNSNYSAVNSSQIARLVAISVTDSQGLPTTQVTMGDALTFRVLYQVFTTKPVHISLHFIDKHNHLINCCGSYSKNITLPSLEVNEYGVFEMRIDCMLEAGLYTFAASLGDISESPNQGEVIDKTGELGPITIKWDYNNQRAPWLGKFGLPVTVKAISLALAQVEIT